MEFSISVRFLSSVDVGHERGSLVHGAHMMMILRSFWENLHMETRRRSNDEDHWDASKEAMWDELWTHEQPWTDWTISWQRDFWCRNHDSHNQRGEERERESSSRMTVVKKTVKSIFLSIFYTSSWPSLWVQLQLDELVVHFLSDNSWESAWSCHPHTKCMFTSCSLSSRFYWDIVKYR